MKWQHRTGPIGVLTAAILLAPWSLGAAVAADATGAAVVPAQPSPVAEALRQRLEISDAGIPAGDTVLSADPLRAFYAARQFRPLWVDEHGPNARAREVLRLIRDGLADFEVAPASVARSDLGGSSVPAATSSSLADAELAINAALLGYARTLRSGHAIPGDVDPEYALTPPAFDATATLMSAADDASLRAHLERLSPGDATFRSLQAALVTARRVASANVAWPALANGPTLQPGESGALVPDIRRILSNWGDYAGPASSSKVYDAALVEAVRGFQARHGLQPDGVVGKQTRAALATSPADRVAQILVNMERWRWMPRDLGNPHVLVNMAGFDLRFVAADQPPLSMRVVVGKPVRRTPVFSDEIVYLEFNPTWTVPKTIAVEDLLPKIRRNPGMLEAQGFRVLGRSADGGYAVDPSHVDWNAVGSGAFPYRLRQAPGPKNPLGRVKFMFPNDFAVYLHDTPARELFARSQRAFSSGCIRVEKPIDLAEALLAGTPGWDRGRIEGVIARGKTQSVTLQRPVPIHLTYLTAWQDDAGKLQFREDLYGRDRRLLRFAIKNSA